MAVSKRKQEETREKPSRSAKKRESLALQKLGEELAALSAEERASLNLPEDLMNALHEYDQLRDREARRRQRQFIGRIMRETPADEIENALSKRRNIRLAHAANFHRAEKWRERLINAEPRELQDLAETLIRESGRETGAEFRDVLVDIAMKAAAEKESGANRGASRRLFREIAGLFR